LLRSCRVSVAAGADPLVACAQWLQLGHATSPMTNQPMPHPTLTPNRALKSAIMQWKGR